MKDRVKIAVLSALIAVIALAAASAGIFSKGGPGKSEYQSIRGKVVEIYGTGLYKHMPADVVVQGIAQDYITLFAAILALIAALVLSLKGSYRGRITLAGVLGYFSLTYTFYLVMAMYNEFFLVYSCLMGCSLFALFFTLKSFDYSAPVPDALARAGKPAGVFLVINAALIGMLWLSIVIPPLLDGSIYPVSLAHFTTLPVQGFDLGLLLPLSVVSGLAMMKGTRGGVIAGSVYLVFLSFLMAALCAKIIFMGMNGYNVMPAAVIIPAIFAACAGFTVSALKSVSKSKED